MEGQTILELAADLARELSALTVDNWHMEQVRDYAAHLTRADGLAVFVKLTHGETAITRNARLEVSGNWPESKIDGSITRFYPYASDIERGLTQYRPISADATRTARALAGDIVRRFLPGFEKERARQMDYKAAHEAAFLARADALGQLAQVLNSRPDSYRANILYNDTGAPWHGKFEVQYHGDVTIELRNLPLGLALAVAAAVTDACSNLTAG